MNVDTWIKERTIFECVAGSHAYGLNTPESDIDYRGVCIPPLDYFLGLYRFEQKDKGWEDGADRTIFNISKYTDLALNANPNILELLWMPEDCILHNSPYWEMLVFNRDLFLSKKIKHTYSRYAHSQLKRIKNHRNWLLNPKEKEPTREEFGLSQKRLSPEVYGIMDSLYAKDQAADCALYDDLGIHKKALWAIFEKERAWKSARREWEQYQTWKKERNPKRAELEAKFGYDTKHASHLFRLMAQGEMALRKKYIPVRLEADQKELCLAVKQGEFSFDAVLEMAATMDDFIATAAESSDLPNAPDRGKVSTILKRIIAGFCDTMEDY